jgi:hypothetical protein
MYAYVYLNISIERESKYKYKYIIHICNSISYAYIYMFYLDWVEPSHSIPLGETWTCNVCKTMQSYRVQLLKFCNITDTGRTLSNQNE